MKKTKTTDPPLDQPSLGGAGASCPGQTILLLAESGRKRSRLAYPTFPIRPPASGAKPLGLHQAPRLLCRDLGNAPHVEEVALAALAGLFMDHQGRPGEGARVELLVARGGKVVR